MGTLSISVVKPGRAAEATTAAASLGLAAGHCVHFYEEDQALLENVACALGSSLGAGGSAIAIATEEHRAGIAALLASMGLDLDFAARQHRYFPLDARQTLELFMVNGRPDPGLFAQALTPFLQQAAAASRLSHGPGVIAAFGEMVALLWQDGAHEAAVQLEELWNQLATRHRLNLYCAYPMQGFCAEGQSERFREICRQHDHVIPGESFAALADEDQRARMVSALQQQVQTLQAVVADREREIELRRQSEERLKIAQDAVIQAEKLAAAGRLAATIAHEINNPLEAVTNFIYLAKTNPRVPKDVCQQLEIADRELARVAQIAQQTLGFYRDTSSARRIVVADVISDVLAVYERRIKGKHLSVHLCLDRGMQLTIKQGELKQVLSNLIANAIDACGRGGSLWLRAKPARLWRNGRRRGIRITVGDDGCGMTREVKQRLFVPFFTTKSNVGTGIGLWVTRSLIEAQGGLVQFRSRTDGHTGTVLSFFLPEQPEPAAAAA